MLHAARDLLLSLYDGRPKVLVVRPPDRAWTFTPLTFGLNWLHAEVLADGGYGIRSMDADVAGETNWRALELPPTNVWVVWTPDEANEIEGLSEWWTRIGGTTGEPVFVRGDTIALGAALWQRALAEINGLTQANQLLLEDMAVLRQSWQHEIRVPPELEELLANLRAAPSRLVFSSPAASDDCEVPSASSGWLSQRLPVGARGFLGIDLHIAEGGVGGVLVIDLIIRETESALAHWRVPAGQLKPGWLPLRLPAASPLSWRDLELRVQLVGGDPALRLSHCPAGLLREYAFAAPGVENVEAAMLAFRLWGGIPGLRAVADRQQAPLSPNPSVAIPEASVANARATRDLSWAYPYFGYLDRGRVLLRPLKVRPSSAAVIASPPTPGLTAVSCEASIDDGGCKTKLLVRIVVAKPGLGPDEVEQGGGVLAASEWVELSQPLKGFLVTARLPMPECGPTEIHFFSRLPQGGTVEHGRVVFSRFEAEFYERADWQSEVILPV
jgi:hypothetical protein